MKFFAVAALFAGALAMPTAETEARTDHNGRHDNPSSPLCPNGLFSNPVCADIDVLGILCLTSQPPSEVPHNAAEFQKICAKSGKEARCAVLPILNQAVLCNLPVGISN